MSSKKSHLNVEGQPHGRHGRRTPLGSLENDIEGFSTPSSRLKSKSQIDVHAVKMKLDDFPFDDSKSHQHFTKMKQTIPPDAARISSGLGDVTFKSFICAGGEVEISESSVCGKENIVLPEGPVTCNPETAGTINSPSMMEQSCCDHVEHPYCNPDPQEFSFSFSEIPNIALSFDEQVIQRHCSEHCGEQNVTLKSFACDGGEVEISDSTNLEDDVIPLPITEPGDLSPVDDINSTYHSIDASSLSPVKHHDHPYFTCENPSVSTTSHYATANRSGESGDGPDHIVFKSVNCTGGEIEVSEETEPMHENISLPLNHSLTVSESNHELDPSVLTGEPEWLNVTEHLDHPYCAVKNQSSPRCDPVAARVSLLCTDQPIGDKQRSIMLPGNHEVAEMPVTTLSVNEETNKAEKSKIPLPEEMFFPSLPSHTGDASAPQTKDENQQTDNHSVSVDDKLTRNVGSPATESPKSFDVTVNDPLDNTSEILLQENNVGPSTVHIGDAQQHLDCVTRVNPESGSLDSGVSSNGRLCNTAEKLEEHLQHQQEVLKILSNCPSLASALDLGILSPIVRRASSSLLKPAGNPNEDQFLDSALDEDKSPVASVPVDPAEFLADHIESPMPLPLFNSTALCGKPHPSLTTEQDKNTTEKICAPPQTDVPKPVVENPFIPELQQLRQMVELLISASGKMCPALLSAAEPVDPPQPTAAVESHSVCVSTSPIKITERSVNTTGLFERKREFTVMDSCTETDPLLWNLPAGSLESLPRQELEQRLRSSLIMTEALAQQLAAVRAHRGPSAGPAPSDLREKTVQTDHTELSQTSMYRELYTEALSRISELELDESNLQKIMQSMQDARVTMVTLSGDTELSLSTLKGVGDVMREDHQCLVSDYEHMTSLLDKSKKTQTRMTEKVKEALQQREEMRVLMDEAVAARDATFSAMEQLREHCAGEIFALKGSAASQEELLTALKQTHPEQVELNQVCVETLKSASDMLSHTMKEHSSLMEELHRVQKLLQRTAPTLQMLNEKTAATLKERDEHMCARNRAVLEHQQMEEELNQTQSNLQNAKQEISNLNLQVTILTSEMEVLRQKLSEKEDEAAQLARKATDLSATISSTLASYRVLEHALADESTKLQESWKDVREAKERADHLEGSLSESEQRVSDLSRTLAEKEKELGQLQTFSKSQSLQLEQLQETCAQLSSVQEMNEFLQMENELTREQISESERVLRTNLQGLRERNLQCEDLKAEIKKLQLEKKLLQEEMESSRCVAVANQVELEEKVAEAITEITLLHHTLRGLTNDLHAAFDEQTRAEFEMLKNSRRSHRTSSAFVSSVTVPLTTEEEENETSKSVSARTPEEKSESLFSEMSAFTRIATPKQKPESGTEDENCMLEMYAELNGTVTELVDTLKLLHHRKDEELLELRGTICDLQAEQEAANSKQQAEVLDLKFQLNRLHSLAERGKQALLMKEQDDKTLTKLMADITDIQETQNKYKIDNSELRNEVMELRRALQQSKVESRVLREELSKSGGQSADPLYYMNEKIRLLREVERLNQSLQEAEQARVKLLDRAKRHQIIYQTNQQKSENELQILNRMINKVRETLMSLPEAVRKCDQLQQLLQYIG